MAGRRSSCCGVKNERPGLRELGLLRINIEMAAFSVLFSIEKAAISIEIRSIGGWVRSTDLCCFVLCAKNDEEMCAHADEEEDVLGPLGGGLDRLRRRRNRRRRDRAGTDDAGGFAGHRRGRPEGQAHRVEVAGVGEPRDSGAAGVVGAQLAARSGDAREGASHAALHGVRRREGLTDLQRAAGRSGGGCGGNGGARKHRRDRRGHRRRRQEAHIY